MNPIKFKGANADLSAPGCNDLPVKRDGVDVVSVWQLDEDDLKALADNGGLITLQIRSGWTQPPVSIYVTEFTNEDGY